MLICSPINPTATTTQDPESGSKIPSHIVPYYLRAKKQLVGTARTESVLVAAASRPLGRGEIISAVGTLGDTPFRIHSTYVRAVLHDVVHPNISQFAIFYHKEIRQDICPCLSFMMQPDVT